MRTLRLFALLEHLRGRRQAVPAEVLALELGVSARTIYRDMSTLQKIGAPIRGEAGMGYVMEKGYFLPPLHFDADELDAIVLGTRLIAARGDAGLAAAARRVSAKVGAVMNGESGERYQRLPLRAVSRESDESLKAAQQLGFLRRAIRDRALTDIEYVDLGGRHSRRLARPLGLTVFDAVWLLTIWCEQKHAFRNLRVDRITHVQRTGGAFRHERDKRFEDYLKTLP